MRGRTHDDDADMVALGISDQSLRHTAISSWLPLSTSAPDVASSCTRATTSTGLAP